MFWNKESNREETRVTNCIATQVLIQEYELPSELVQALLGDLHNLVYNV